MEKTKLIAVVMAVAAMIVLLVLGDKIAETNEAGKFHIKRAFLTGDIRGY